MPSIKRRHLSEHVRSSADHPGQHSAASWHSNMTSTSRPTHDAEKDYEYRQHGDDAPDYYYYYYEDYDENEAPQGVHHSSQHAASSTSTHAPAASGGRELTRFRCRQ